MEKFRALPNQSRQKSSEISSSFLKEVYLLDWWLVKFPTDSKPCQIGVAGVNFKESQDARIFQSAAISKRIDAVTLEAIDGIIIVLNDCINRSRTIQNGFTFEICNHFCVGFPYYWEEITGQACEQSTQRCALPRISFDDFNSFDDLPATFLRDFCSPGFYDSESCTISNDFPVEIPPKNGDIASKDSEISCHQNKRAASEVATSNEGPSQQKKSKVKKKRDMQSCKAFERSEGRITRSMSKAKKVSETSRE